MLGYTIERLRGYVNKPFSRDNKGTFLDEDTRA